MLQSTLLDPGQGGDGRAELRLCAGRGGGSGAADRPADHHQQLGQHHHQGAELRITSLSEVNGAPEPGVTTQPPAPAQLRVINPATTTSTFTIGGAAVTVQNLSVDPPASYNPATPGTGGGGLNTTLTIPLPSGLAPGASVSIAFSFAVDGHGPYWFGYDVDASTAAGPLTARHQPARSGTTTDPSRRPHPRVSRHRAACPLRQRTRQPAMTPTGSHEVYGLHFTGLSGAGLLPADGLGPPRVEVSHAQQAREPARIGTEQAVLDLPEDRQLSPRGQGTATFTGPPLSPDELVHPYLGAAASVFSRWAGREVFHAGAFVCGGLAWAVVGGREAGKSSLLAALAARRLPVLADDLVITDGQEAFCGPRTIDLRQPSPGATEPVTPARGASRWRLSLPPLPGAVPLGGWIYLRWCTEVAMAAVPASDLLARLAARRSLAGPALRSRDPAGARRPARRGTSGARPTGAAWTRPWT